MGRQICNTYSGIRNIITMKILITGATGFIGPYVVKELLKYNAQQIIIATKNKEFEHEGSCLEYHFLDLNNLAVDENYFLKLGKPDMLFHLAWQGLPNYTSPFHFEENLFSQYFFLKNMVANGLKKIVVTGTCFEYGMQQGRLKEDLLTDPQNAYAIAKDTLRKFLFQLKNDFSFECTWVRLFYMYGGGQNKNALFSQLEAALQRGDKVFNMSGGDQVRDFLPVEKVAEYVVKIGLSNFYGIINCCSGEPIKIKTLVENYLKSTNRQIELNTGYYPYNTYEPMSFWGNNTKLKNIINDRSNTGI